MVYVGNGRALAALSSRKVADMFIDVFGYQFIVESAEYAKSYPQCGKARQNPGIVFNDDGSVNAPFTITMRDVVSDYYDEAIREAARQ